MTAHSAFEHLRSHPIESLRIELQEYRHRKTGARHLHLASEDTNNVFLVAFMTVPQDSTGVAHILEHTALCGSQRYPVRDPFFMMTRRSLNTFMNAFTASDWTAYPFASQNKKDFNNLLDVYLDAAFFPLLRDLDFAQEGHRIEFSDTDDPNSPLVYKGVVYNEMKGAMSAPVQRLAQELQSALFPSITYHYNSGGEPSDIPSLTHEALKAFHQRHYHPSNALFMTYGDIPAIEHQARFEERALAHFDRLDIDCQVPDEPAFSTPRTLTRSYAIDESDTAEHTHVVVGWTLGTIVNPRDVLEAHILAAVLLDNSSSPLRHALETSELGNGPSPLCGIDTDNRQMVFAAGLEGSEAEHADTIEQAILSVIRDVAENGVAPEVLQSVLHQLEFSQREITGGGYPYGLQLIIEALPSALHGGDPAAALDQDALLEQLRQDIEDPTFIKRLARQLLLDNPHRVRLVMTPDPELDQRTAQAEKDTLDRVREALDEAERARIKERANALHERQNEVEDPDLLPCVTLADVPAEMHIPSGESRTIASIPSTFFATGTNGITYQQLVIELPDLDAELLDTLPLLAVCLTEVGVNGYDYLQTQARQAAVSGSVSAGYMARRGVAVDAALKGVFTLSGKCLNRNQSALTELMTQTFLEPRFDEHTRLRELMAQFRSSREQRVVSNGHLLAMNAAGASLSPTLALSHRWDGLDGLVRLQQLDDALDEPGEIERFAARLARLCERLRSAPRHLLIVAEHDQHDALAQTLATQWSALPPAGAGIALNASADANEAPVGYSTSTQVNYCAKAYEAVTLDHPDAPALQVLGGFLRNGYLHRALREQGGAYGGGAGYNGDSATFRFFSYRDPRFDGTFDDFDRSVEWLQSANHEPQALEEAILGVIAAIDRPSSPAGEAISTFYAQWFDRDPDFRRRFRQRVLDVSMEDLRRVAVDYLQPERGRLAAIGSSETLREHADWNTTTL